MKNYTKYSRAYFMPPQECLQWTKREYIDKAPLWCSVDLRDGNQALITPMSLTEKVEFFQKLVAVGFKEIEIGFPAASETEYEFARKLIEENLIPDDVTIQVLTQAREHIIRKTFEAIEGAKKAVVHLYNSTSVAQREQVFKKSKEEIIKIAAEGAELLNTLAKETKGNFLFEYSPESFTGTEMEFALEICNRVLDVFKPTKEKKVIINCPVTVSFSMSHVYASQIEYISTHLKYRENVILSLHPHNDRGCAIADTELALLAGGDRVEGTIFGNGERTGNVDIVTLAMNLFSHGIDPKLDFSDMQSLVKTYEKLTGMSVNPRQPYAGSLVFTAFSGSHQDAIAKGLNHRKENPNKCWSVPYLSIDPKDVGRNYEADVIRINSQSGKGGIGYLLETNFGFILPPKMREDCGYLVKNVSDHKHKELKPDEVYEVFKNAYIDIESPYKLENYTFKKFKDKTVVEISIASLGDIMCFSGEGNGILDAVSNALKANLLVDYSDLIYTEHALGEGSHAKAAAYVGINVKGKIFWATGIDTDIMIASIKALLGAINKSKKSN